MQTWPALTVVVAPMQAGEYIPGTDCPVDGWFQRCECCSSITARVLATDDGQELYICGKCTAKFCNGQTAQTAPMAVSPPRLCASMKREELASICAEATTMPPSSRTSMGSWLHDELDQQASIRPSSSNAASIVCGVGNFLENLATVLGLSVSVTDRSSMLTSIKLDSLTAAVEVKEIIATRRSLGSTKPQRKLRVLV